MILEYWLEQLKGPRPEDIFKMCWVCGGKGEVEKVKCIRCKGAGWQWKNAHWVGVGTRVFERREKVEREKARSDLGT